MAETVWKTPAVTDPSLCRVLLPEAPVHLWSLMILLLKTSGTFRTSSYLFCLSVSLFPSAAPLEDIFPDH